MAHQTKAAVGCVRGGPRADGMGYSLSLLLILKESKHDCATTLHRKTTPMVAIDAVESTAFAYANCRVFRRSVAFGKFCPATRGAGKQWSLLLGAPVLAAGARAALPGLHLHHLLPTAFPALLGTGRHTDQRHHRQQAACRLRWSLEHGSMRAADGSAQPARPPLHRTHLHSSLCCTLCSDRPTAAFAQTLMLLSKKVDGSRL